METLLLDRDFFSLCPLTTTITLSDKMDILCVPKITENTKEHILLQNGHPSCHITNNVISTKAKITTKIKQRTHKELYLTDENVIYSHFKVCDRKKPQLFYRPYKIKKTKLKTKLCKCQTCSKVFNFESSSSKSDINNSLTVSECSNIKEHTHTHTNYIERKNTNKLSLKY